MSRFDEFCSAAIKRARRCWPPPNVYGTGIIRLKLYADLSAACRSVAAPGLLCDSRREGQIAAIADKQVPARSCHDG
jgi:hypothetical protein